MEGLVCGLDEVGRAPLAGPVVAACVFIPREYVRKKIWREVNDSKLLPKQKRAELSIIIKENCAWAIAEASSTEIENINIVQASFLAMTRAFGQCFATALPPASPRKNGGRNLPQTPPVLTGGYRGEWCSTRHTEFNPATLTALIDGHIVPRAFPCATKPIIKGDTKSVSIAAASIIAKVYRDELMAKLAEEHPHYGWEHNAGYPTKKHLNGIEAHGLTAHHRKTFISVRNFLEFGSINPQMKLAV